MRDFKVVRLLPAGRGSGDSFRRVEVVLDALDKAEGRAQARWVGDREFCARQVSMRDFEVVRLLQREVSASINGLKEEGWGLV
jgi:hypothetical protein